MSRAGKAPDEQHPFGYAKELYFWAFVVAVVIFGLGGGVTIVEGLERLRDPHVPANPLWNYVVLAVAFVFESISFVVAVRQLRRDEPGVSLFSAVAASKDPSVFAVVLEDTAALIGLLIAFAGTLVSQLTGDGRPDGVASIAIGVVLDLVALVLVWQVRGLLVGEAADPDVVDAIRDVAVAEPSVDAVRRVLTMHLGPDDILVALDLVFRHDTPLAERRRSDRPDPERGGSAATRRRARSSSKSTRSPRARAPAGLAPAQRLRCPRWGGGGDPGRAGGLAKRPRR